MANRVLFIPFAFTILLLPVLVSPFFAEHFLTVKYLAFDIAAGLVACSLLSRKQTLCFNLSKATAISGVVALLFFLIAYLKNSTAIDFMSIIHMISAGILLCGACHLSHVVKIETIAKLVLISAIPVLIIAIFQHLNPLPGQTSVPPFAGFYMKGYPRSIFTFMDGWRVNVPPEQPVSAFGNLNLLAQFLGFVFLLGLFLIKQAKSPFERNTLIGYMGVIAWLTTICLSRTAAVGIAIPVVFLVLRKQLKIMSIIAIAIVALSWSEVINLCRPFVKHAVSTYVQSIYVEVQDTANATPSDNNATDEFSLGFELPGWHDRHSKVQSTQDRLALLKISWSMIKDRPFFGIGTGQFHFASIPYQAEFDVLQTKRIQASPHNELLNIAVEWGLPALFSLLIFSCLWIKDLLKCFRYNGKPHYWDIGLSLTLFFAFQCFLQFPLQNAAVVLLSVIIVAYMAMQMVTFETVEGNRPIIVRTVVLTAIALVIFVKVSLRVQDLYNTAHYLRDIRRLEAACHRGSDMWRACYLVAFELNERGAHRDSREILKYMLHIQPYNFAALKLLSDVDANLGDNYEACAAFSIVDSWFYFHSAPHHFQARRTCENLKPWSLPADSPLAENISLYWKASAPPVFVTPN